MGFFRKRGLPAGPIYYAVNNDANFSLKRDGIAKDSLTSGYKQAFGKPADDEYLIELIKKSTPPHLLSFLK